MARVCTEQSSLTADADRVDNDANRPTWANLTSRITRLPLFANKQSTRLKVLVHDGIGIWLAAPRLYHGRFVWPGDGCGASKSLTREQLDALVLGLPWQRVGEAGTITLLQDGSIAGCADGVSGAMLAHWPSMIDIAQLDPTQLDKLDAKQLRELRRQAEMCIPTSLVWDAEDFSCLPSDRDWLVKTVATRLIEVRS